VPMPRPTYPLRGRESYNTHVSCCLSSATAAWIAAVIVAISVTWLNNSPRPFRLRTIRVLDPERWFADSPLEGTGFEPSVPLL
jgi:hypothetical protein